MAFVRSSINSSNLVVVSASFSSSPTLWRLKQVYLRPHRALTLVSWFKRTNEKYFFAIFRFSFLPNV